MTIREMQSTDRAEVFAMMRTFYDSPALLTKVPDDVLRRNISTCISNSPYLEGFVFEHNQQTIGYGMVATSYSTERGGLCVWLEDIYIKPAFRGRGYGSTFFAFVEQRFAGMAVRYRLEAARDNTVALQFYGKMGYSETEYCAMIKEN